MSGLSNFRYQEFSSGFAIGSVVVLTTPTHHTECGVCVRARAVIRLRVSEEMLHAGRGTFWLLGGGGLLAAT